MNKTLLERARSMLSQAGISKDFWAEVVNTTCYMVNRSPCTAIELKTSKEVWSSSLTDYSHLRIFSCPVYIHVTGDKLELRATQRVKWY
ncbi:unnamed protein product [Spirodela intermedia]|uniref:Uncharacterized protein n=1 Tax=Spirodela intermedia TaxID=51605 RepID=A0A7I8K589_SPIIN|nr:unnamed protein product [Spirodela intermedia]